MHVHNQDILPFIALADLEDRAPVLLLDHADHMFWLGAQTVDLVISTRNSGRELAIKRRYIAEDRALLLPLCLEDVAPRRTLSAVRQQLGLAKEDVLLLSAARAVKYRDLE